MYIYMYIYMGIYTYIYIYKYTYICIYIYLVAIQQNLTNMYKYIYMYIHIYIVSVSQNARKCELIENQDVIILKMNLIGLLLNPKWLQDLSGVLPEREDRV